MGSQPASHKYSTVPLMGSQPFPYKYSTVPLMGSQPFPYKYSTVPLMGSQPFPYKYSTVPLMRSQPFPYKYSTVPLMGSQPFPYKYSTVPLMGSTISVQGAGRAPGPVWTYAKNLASTGIRTPNGPARSQSLYRVSYHCPCTLCTDNLFYVMLYSLKPTLNSHGSREQ
jgi:hypothetical protein